ncbi:TetR/AcrR family transcriptional regulator [Chachezhania sediminis]|uniref:TetR/AcrR family transcriptional regulator n=1 Tax=Chachezhania sediminis TaxID=2599291 RepID=UPI00131C2EA5|nr:TetR/AcrR family transcriptional regulator [Chachezhania sediminis]
MVTSENRNALIRAAALLFRQRGYHGVALAEILKAADLPKGSLYYHFPGGKRDLATQATLAAGRTVEKIVNRAFGDADSFGAGAAAFCDEIADFLQPGKMIEACPVASVLQASTSEPELREAARQVLKSWGECLVMHAARLGHPTPHDVADLVLMQMEGAWLLAVAEQNARPFERLAQLYRAGLRV